MLPGRNPGTSSNVMIGMLNASQKRTKRAPFTDASISRHPVHINHFLLPISISLIPWHTARWCPTLSPSHFSHVLVFSGLQSVCPELTLFLLTVNVTIEESWNKLINAHSKSFEPHSCSGPTWTMGKAPLTALLYLMCTNFWKRVISNSRILYQNHTEPMRVQSTANENSAMVKTFSQSVPFQWMLGSLPAAMRGWLATTPMVLPFSRPNPMIMFLA